MSEKMYNDLVNQNSLLSSYTYANRLMEEYSLLASAMEGTGNYDIQEIFLSR